MFAVLVLQARGSVPRRAVLGLLIVFAVGTELLQTLVPMRSPELADCLQNLAGIALGGGLRWLTAPVAKLFTFSLRV